MGFIDTAPEAGLPIFYNVVHAVGKQCPNLRDDVKLVQYLLIALYEKYPKLKPPGELAVTGTCDTTTINWITSFQMETKRHNPMSAVYPDGRIDRIRNKSLVGSISKAMYSLAVLNKNVAYNNQEAYLALPGLVPLENAATVPGPTPDIVKPPAGPTSWTGGA